MYFVGDIVRVVRRTKMDKEIKLAWNERMSDTIGHTGKILNINNGNHPGLPEILFLTRELQNSNIYHLDSIELESDPERLKIWEGR